MSKKMKVLKTNILFLRNHLVIQNVSYWLYWRNFGKSKLYLSSVVFLPIGVGDSDVDEVTDVVIKVDDIDDDSGDVIRLLTNFTNLIKRCHQF